MEIPRNWTFETAGVAAGFDRHVREQLPWYDLATNAIAHIARHYIPDGGLIYDLGASTGNIGRAIAPVLKDRSAQLISIEPSAEMVKRYEAPGKIVRAKAEDYDYEGFDLAVVFLTLMFVEPRKRTHLMKRLRRACRPGGAIIVLDKLEPDNGYLSTVFYRLALAGKRAAGVTPDEIIQKELSISGVQRPITKHELGGEAYLWFRFGDFAGWVIEQATHK
jgi:tRNA (cmo5U34)-methyltransferase